MYEIKREDGGLFGEPGSREQHLFALGNNQSNDSETTTDLIQKLYMLFATGEVMTKDKDEAHSEETAVPVNDKRQDIKGNVRCIGGEHPEVPLLGFFPDERRALGIDWHRCSYSQQDRHSRRAYHPGPQGSPPTQGGKGDEAPDRHKGGHLC